MSNRNKKLKKKKKKEKKAAVTLWQRRIFGIEFSFDVVDNEIHTHLLLQDSRVPHVLKADSNQSREEDGFVSATK